MADNKDKRSLWKRVSEGIQTFVPKDPGSYGARKLSIEAQRDNAINWLSKQPFVERSKEEFGTDLPSHLLKDQQFAKELHERFGENVADKVIPLEVRRFTEYQAATTENYSFLNTALKHDEIALQLPTRDHTEHFSESDKLHAIETVRRMGPEEALEFLTKELTQDPAFLNEQEEYMPGYAPKLTRAQQQALSSMSDEILTSKEFLLAVDKAGVNLNALPQHIRDNDKLMAECVQESPFFYEVASKEVRSNQECFLASIRSIDDLSFNHHEKIFSASSQAARNYASASVELRSKAENLTLANAYSWNQIPAKEVPANLRNNKSVIEELLLCDPNALRYASRELRKDRQFVEEMTAKYAIDTSRFDLIKDRQIALNLARTDSIQLDQLPQDLQNDREFVAGLVKLNGVQLQFAKPEFQDDYEIARNAVSCTFNDSAALEHCSSRLRADTSIVYSAVETNPCNIEYAAAELRDNNAMGMHVVKGAPWTVEYLSERLRNDLDIAKEVIDQDPESAMELGSDLKEKLIANLSLEDKKQYEHWYHEGESELAGKYIANGLEPYLISLEKENIAHELQKFQEREQERVISQSELSTKEDIAVWLKHYGVEDFTINDDLTVDVSGDVNLKSKFTGHEIETDIYVGDNLGHTVVEEKLSGIPFQFGKVEGNFDISDNGYDKTVVDVEGLKSLKGCPTEVKGNFDCSANPALRSLEDGPKVVGGNLNISNTSVESLDKAPRVNGQITAEGLPNLANEVKVRNDQSAAMAKLVAPYDAVKEGPLPSQVKKPKQVMKQKI
jgi:hypothetical protein